MNFHLFLWQVVGSPVRQSHLLFSWLQRAGIRHRSPRLPIWQRRDQKLLTRTIGGIVRCSLEQYFRQIITRLIPDLLAGPLSSVIFLSMLLFDGCHRCPVGCREVVSGWGQAWQTGGKSEVRVHACSLFCGTLAETQINKWIIQRKVHPPRAWEETSETIWVQSINVHSWKASKYAHSTYCDVNQIKLKQHSTLPSIKFNL